MAPHLHAASTTPRSPSVINHNVGSRAFSTGSIGNVHADCSHVDPPAAASLLPHGTGHAHAHAHAPSKKTKAKKAADPSETSKLLAAKISQLELDKAGEKDQEAEIGGWRVQTLNVSSHGSAEREVKKANRDLSNLLCNIESPLSRLDVVQKKYTELLAEMRRLDRDHVKNKKRAELLQKEKDHGRSELTKTMSMKEKLEKLCRELQKENKKMKDEHKRLEETEKRERVQLNARFEGVLTDVRDVIAQKEEPKRQTLDIEMDEL